MPKFIQFAVPFTCASLVLPLVLPENSEGQAYDQPHNHSESKLVEAWTLAPSMYTTNTTAATVSTVFYPVVWVIQSSDSTFDYDLLVADRLKAGGVTLIVQSAQADPKGGTG